MKLNLMVENMFKVTHFDLCIVLQPFAFEKLSSPTFLQHSRDFRLLLTNIDFMSLFRTTFYAYFNA